MWGLRGLCSLQEARALLGRLEFQRGNIEAALHVFDGIDIAAVTPKIKASIARRAEGRRRRSSSDAAPPMSIHAISLLFEAILLKARSLQDLGRFKGMHRFLIRYRSITSLLFPNYFLSCILIFFTFFYILRGDLLRSDLSEGWFILSFKYHFNKAVNNFSYLKDQFS